MADQKEKALREELMLAAFRGGWYAAHAMLAEGFEKSGELDWAKMMRERAENPPEIDVQEMARG